MTTRQSPGHRLFIDGQFVEGGGEAVRSFNPATTELVATIPGASTDQVDLAVRAAHRVHAQGVLHDAAERSRLMHRIADEMEARSDDILRAAVTEVGTPVSLARSLHCSTPISMLRWFADAATHDWSEYRSLPSGDGPPNEALVVRDPVGVVAAICAYNYPLMFAAGKVGAAMAAGCPSVVLPAPATTLSTLIFAECLAAAGTPAGAVSVVAGGAEVGQALTSHRSVAKVSFTGSVEIGRQVMAQASSGPRDIVLELGGKSAAIVLPSADLATAVPGIHARYLRNAGQGCMSPTRLLVPEPMVEEFVERSVQFYDQLPMGDPWDEATHVGPVISEAHQARIGRFVQDALDSGAQVLARKPAPELAGWYVDAVLLGGLDNAARINQEEVFGPVGTVIPTGSLEEAITIANDTRFGLHASIWGETTKALKVARHMQCGLVTINGGGGRRLDVPTGGIRESGIGREYGLGGIEEFLASKTIQWASNP